MGKIITIMFLSVLVNYTIVAQTCCSGGVPLAGNIGFVNSTPQTFQLDLSYDRNILNTLKEEDKLLDDKSRKRLTQSVLLKAGYSLSNGLAIEGLFSYVTQTRVINQFENEVIDKTSGIGDAVLLLKYSRLIRNLFINVAAGPKLPLGKHDLTNDIGIPFNADLQPGSGSWDMLGWINFSRTAKIRPSLSYYSSFTYRYNGKNKEYFDTQVYQFGNSVYAILGISDRFVLNKLIIDPSISLSYRNTRKDRIDNNELDNTGGQWLFLSPSLSFNPTQSISFYLTPELPVYSKVIGTQLSPTVRLRVGIYYLFTKKKKIEFNNGLL